jgi:hypothetical protein
MLLPLLLAPRCSEQLLRARLAVGTAPCWLLRGLAPAALALTALLALATLTSMTAMNIKSATISTPSTATPAMAPVPRMLEKASAPPCC